MKSIVNILSSNGKFNHLLPVAYAFEDLMAERGLEVLGMPAEAIWRLTGLELELCLEFTTNDLVTNWMDERVRQSTQTAQRKAIIELTQKSDLTKDDIAKTKLLIAEAEKDKQAQDTTKFIIMRADCLADEEDYDKV